MISINKYKNVSDENEIINPLDSINILAEKLGKDKNDLKELFDQIGNNLRNKNIPEEQIRDKTLSRIQADLKAFLLKEPTPEELEKIDLLTEEHERYGVEEEPPEKDDDAYYIDIEKQYEKYSKAIKFEDDRQSIIYGNDETPGFVEDFFSWNGCLYNKVQTGPTTYFVIDKLENICEQVKIYEDKKTGKRKENSKIKLSYFSLSNLVEYQPIKEFKSAPMFSFTIHTINNTEKLKTASLDELVGELKSRGLFLKTSQAMDILSNAINCLKFNHEYTTEDKSPYPGFFILNNKFVSTESYTIPSKKQMTEALNLFNDFGDSYDEFSKKFGYVGHWGIIAPFSYVIIQKGCSNLLNNVLLFGTTRAGKSTVSKMPCFFWCLDLNDQTTSGSHIHSRYQFGKVISRSTFPIIIDEGEGLFENNELLSMVKTSTHSLSARARFNSNLQREEEIMAFSPSIITSNYNKPNDGAVGARIDLLTYTTSKIRSKEDREQFDKKFKPNIQNGPLKILKFIGDYVASKIIEDPTLLDDDWLKLSKSLWREMYEYANMKMPSWMINIAHPESVEESFEDEQNYYETNIKALILSKADINNIISNDFGQTENDFITPKDKVKDVISNSRWSWIHCYTPTTGINAGEKFVRITKAIETDLRKEKHFNIQLNRIAELLGGKITRKTHDGHKINLAEFEYSKFIDSF